MKSAETRNKRRDRLPILAGAALALALLLTGCAAGGGDAAGDGTGSLAERTQTIKEGEALVILPEELSSAAKFYPVTVDGTKMEVLAVRTPDGKIRTAFNTCEVCNGSPKAYFKQSGDVLVCQNCGNQFPMTQVEEEAGGCNPWPVFAENKTVTEDSITISYEFLKESKDIFSNWKKGV